MTGAHDTVLDYADSFSVTLHDDNIQEFDTRVLLSMSKIPPMISWKVCTNLEYESEQLQIVLEEYDMEIH